MDLVQCFCFSFDQGTRTAGERDLAREDTDLVSGMQCLPPVLAPRLDLMAHNHGVGKYNSSNRRCAGAPNLQDFSQRPDWGAIGPPLAGVPGRAGFRGFGGVPGHRNNQYFQARPAAGGNFCLSARCRVTEI